MPSDHLAKGISVRGTEIRATEARHRYREKIARVTLDSMVQFVGLLDAEGTVLEINKVALDAVGLTLADVEGKPFWTTFWWQVSPEINQGIRDAIARAVKGEFVRWDTPLYASPDGTVTIIIDASVMPVKDDRGQGGVPRLRRARHHREEGAGARDRAEEHRAAGAARTDSRARRDQDAVLRQRQPRASDATRPDPRAGAAPDRRSPGR